jgi:hypothetical protein
LLGVEVVGADCACSACSDVACGGSASAEALTVETAPMASIAAIRPDPMMSVKARMATFFVDSSGIRLRGCFDMFEQFR